MSVASLKLHRSPASPFVRIVEVALLETGISDRVERVAATGTPLDPGSLPLVQNPLGKIPTLERSDGPAIYDSRVICRYLDDLAGGRLYPQPPRLWETLTLEATAHGIAEAAVSIVYEDRLRSEQHRSAPWVKAQWSKVARSLDAVESRWMSHLAGPLDMSHVALGCALGYLDLRHGAREWRDGRPALAGWAARFLERPAMAATSPAA